MLLHFITGCCIGAFYRTHSWQTESRHCLYLAASSCRSCYPLRYPYPCLRYCVPFAIALPRLAPSFTDVLPYRLLLLHLNSRLHARSQYRTSVTLMMALHDVARHSAPSSIENRYAREQKSSVPKPFGIRHGGFLHTHDSILPHIFRFEISGIFGSASEGGRGVVCAKQGEKTFSLDPFSLIYRYLHF